MRNDHNDLFLINFTVVRDLTNSKISYDSALPRLEFNSSYLTSELKLDLTRTIGPISDIDVTIDCPEYEISRGDILTPERCLYYVGFKYGELLSFMTLQFTFDREIDILVTSKYILCACNQVIAEDVTLEWNMSVHGNCSLRQFSQSYGGSMILMVCSNSMGSYLHQIHVADSCASNMTITDIEVSILSDPGIRFFDVLGSFPEVMIEAPVLFPENKRYYVCTIDKNQTTNCTALVAGSKKYFMSKDFDVRYFGNRTYALILEDGLIVYALSKSREAESNVTRWLSPFELKGLDIEAPFTYTSIVDIGNGNLTIEIGTTYESYELTLILETNVLRKSYHFMKYLDCQYDRDSQPMYLGRLVFKTCFTIPEVNYLLAGAYPVYESPPKKYIMIFLRQSDIGWPISMNEIQLAQSISISDDYVVVNSRANLLCYYKITITSDQEISWTVDLESAPNSSACNLTARFYNDYYQANYTVGVTYAADPAGAVREPFEIRIGAAVLVVFSGVFMWRELKEQKKQSSEKTLRRKIKKMKSSSRDLGFFSNDF